MSLYDSDTNDYVTADELGVSETEYAELVAESMASEQAEGHVRTSTGRRVYAPVVTKEIAIPQEHARTVLWEMCVLMSSSGYCTLSTASTPVLDAVRDWSDARDPIPETLAAAIREGRVRPDARWHLGPCEWIVEMLDAAESC